MTKPILCLDFDGVLHSYTSGWKGADVIPDPPVARMASFLRRANEAFEIHVFSSRAGQPGGLPAMQAWLQRHVLEYFGDRDSDARILLQQIRWPTEKPAAFVTIDDRAIQFDGRWPTVAELKNFRPWNKREVGATGRFPDGIFNKDDEGELRLAVYEDGGLVRVDFGKPVAWLAMPPANARAFAAAILDKCGTPA